MTAPTPSTGYAPFMMAQAVSAIGSWMQKTCMGWLIWDMTHSVGWVGALALSDLVSALWVAPFAGAVTDRVNPYRLMRVTQVMLLVQVLVLAWVTGNGHASAPMLVAFAVVESSLQGFSQPVRMTVLGSLAGPGRLPRAIALSSMMFNLARAVGPALAGLVLLRSSATFVFLLNAVSFLAMLAAIVRVRRHIDASPARRSASLGQDIAQGYGYVVRTPAIAMVMLLALVFSLFGRAFGELLPAFAGQVFHGGPPALSLLMSAQGIGAVAGAIWMLRSRDSVALIRIALGGALTCATAITAFCLLSDLKVAAAVMVIAGLGHVVCNIAMQSFIQLRTDPAFRGRAVALYGLIFRAGPALGAFVIGMAAPWAGLQWLVGGGAALFGLMTVCGYLPRVRALTADAPATVGRATSSDRTSPVAAPALRPLVQHGDRGLRRPAPSSLE